MNSREKSRSLGHIWTWDVPSGQHVSLPPLKYRWNASDSQLTVSKTRLRRQMRFLRPSIGCRIASVSRSMSTSRLHFLHWLHRLSETARRSKSVPFLDCEHPGKSSVYITWTISALAVNEGQDWNPPLFAASSLSPDVVTDIRNMLTFERFFFYRDHWMLT